MERFRQDMNNGYFEINHIVVPDRPDEECLICLDERSDIRLIPCNHTCICSHCAHHYRRTYDHCPLCRTPIDRANHLITLDNI